jgi:hypothetical protein
LDSFNDFSNIASDSSDEEIDFILNFVINLWQKIYCVVNLKWWTLINSQILINSRVYKRIEKLIPPPSASPTICPLRHFIRLFF